MAQPKQFIYSLINTVTGKFYRVNGGLVNQISSITPLKVPPDGYQNKSIKWQKNMKYGGLWRSFTNPFKFILDSALIVRDRTYKTFGREKMAIVIHSLDRSFGGGWVHRFFYRGDLNLSDTTDTNTGIEVPVLEGALAKAFKAFENTTFDIPINVPEAVAVYADGVILNETKNYITQADNSLPGDHLVGILFTVSEGEAVGVAAYQVFSGAVPGDLTTSLDYFLSTSQVVTGMIISGSLRFKFLTISGTYKLKLKSNLGRNDEIFSQAYASGVEYIVPFNFTFDADTDEKFFLIGEDASPLGLNSIFETDIKVTYKSRAAATTVKALRPAYIAQKLLDAMAGPGFTFTSNYLTQVWDNLTITSGDAIRGFEDAVVSISWAEFFDSFTVPGCLSCGILNNTVLWIEDLAYIYQQNTLLNFPTVKDFKVETAKDYQYSSLKIGYPNTSTEDVNGRDEFNVTERYTFANTDVNKELTLVSKIIASMYEIENCRITTKDKTTTDDDRDKRNFFLHLEKAPQDDGLYHFLRPNFDSITGIVNPSSAINVLISPKHCFYNWGRFLRSILMGLETTYIKFEGSDKNSELSVTLDGVTISEKASVLVGTLPDPLFYAYNILFNGPMPPSLTVVMNASPNGVFTIQSDGETWYGFPTAVSVQPTNRPSQDCTVLVSPQTNLEKLIVYGRQ